MEEKEVRDQSIYLVRHGSVAYGTNTPSSDVDEKGVAVPSSSSYYYGFDRFEQKDSGWADKTDRVIYDLRKFVALASDCNPNIVEVLYVDPSDYLKVTKAGRMLLAMRELFLSQKASMTFSGYAMAQLHRIEGHYKWRQNPPSEPVELSFTSYHDITPYDKPFEKKFGGHEIKVSSWIETCGGNDIEVLIKTFKSYATIKHVDHEAFDAAKKNYANYLNWLANRNPKRAAIEEQHGYDCKHAYHLIRLLRMGKEILAEGKVLVKRPDKDELLAIRNGKYTYPELIEMAKDLKNEVDKAVLTSPLPKGPDRNRIQKETMDIVDFCRRHNDAYMEV
jgi:predicted nucleotidyltransferase